MPGGELWRMRRDPLGTLLRLGRSREAVVRYRVGWSEFYLLNHPDCIEEVLVTRSRNFTKGQGLRIAARLLGNGLLTSEGSLHDRQRKLLQPAFQSAAVETRCDAIPGCCHRWAERLRDGQAVDAAAEMTRLTLSVTARVLFGEDTPCDAARISADVEAVIDAGAAFVRDCNLFSPKVADLLSRLPLPATRRFRASRNRLRAAARQLIERRRRDRAAGSEWISAMLDAGVSDEQVCDEALTLLLSGHETMAMSLTWTLYLLARHPDAADSVAEEVDGVLGGSPPAAVSVGRLERLQMVFREAMRLYPPVWMIGRRAIEDCPVGRFHLPRNSFVIASQYVTHHDPRYFPEPFRFDPRRWTQQAVASRPRYSYFPFGAGSRHCIGDRLARLEAAIVLAWLAQRWRFLPHSAEPVQPRAMITLRPWAPIRLVMERRTAAQARLPKEQRCRNGTNASSAPPL